MADQISRKRRIIRKPHRYRISEKSRKEIRLYQKTTNLLIRKLPFQRLVREIAAHIKDGFRFQGKALDGIQNIFFLRSTYALCTK